MRVALLVVHTNSYFANLVPIARLLADSGAWEPRFLFANWYPTVLGDQQRCRDEGFAYSPELTREPAQRPWLARVVMQRVTSTTPYALGQHAATLRRLRALIREHRIALLITPADNRYDLGVYVKAAHDEGIKAVAVPAFMAASSEWAQFVREDPAHQLDRWSNQVVAALYPRWVHTHGDKQLIALPAHEVLARQWLGIAPPQPWTLHSGHADAIAIESEALRQYCMLEGIAPRQMVLTGSVDHDRMHERLADAAALREATYRRLGMPANRPLLLTALPPDMLYGRGRKECDFTEFAALARCWLEPLVAAKGWNVVVSLHPSVKRETMRYLEDFGCKLADEPTSSLIPICDLYVASVSATIQWAIACGVPVLNYDVYRYRYPDYRGVDGVVHVEEKADYAAAVTRMTSDREYLDALRTKQARHARYWGVLDGKAGERLLALFDQLSGREQAA